MKNSIILKDEIGILRADKSAVLTELRKGSEDLKNIEGEIFRAEAELVEVRKDITDETARLDDIRGRAVSCKKELNTLSQDVKNMQNAYDVSRVRNSQEQNLHLGRIKDLKDDEKFLLTRINELKTLYDRSADQFASHTSDNNKKLREQEKLIASNEAKIFIISKALVEIEEKERKITKERLKREDKVREREKRAEQFESSLGKREEDLVSTVRDLQIIYGRLKRLYAEKDPAVDIDKLITMTYGSSV